MRNPKTKRMSMVELISSDAKNKAGADVASNRVVIRHLRQSRCCLPRECMGGSVAVVGLFTPFFVLLFWVSCLFFFLVCFVLPSACVG